MPYIHTLQEAPSFSGIGLEGHNFGPLQKNIDIFLVESTRGHDTFMYSKNISRVYYVISGAGHFTIDNNRYDVRAGMLVEVPPQLEFTYSGEMTLIGFAQPRWYRGCDVHTRWNPDVTSRDPSSLPDREPWLERLIRATIAGKSPARAFLRLNRQIWNRLPKHISELRLVHSYGECVHAFSRKTVRAQAFNTYFLRNRPILELIRRFLESKNRGEQLQVAVLGCSFGAEVYSIAWRILTARPDLKLVLSAMDISSHAVEFAKRGVYKLNSSESIVRTIFDRMTAAEKEDFFCADKESAAVKPWIKEPIRWCIGDAGDPSLVDELGQQDLVVANNFLCHMRSSEAESCLRNIGRLVKPNGHIVISGIDLDVRTKVAHDLSWTPMEELIEEIHEGDPVMREHWPWSYGGLEPLDKKKKDWRIRYSTAFRVPGIAESFIHSGNTEITLIGCQ